MWPKWKIDSKRDVSKGIPVYTLPSNSDGKKAQEQEQNKTTKNNEVAARDQKNSCRILTATFAILAVLITTSVGIYATVHMMEDTRQLQLINRPNPITVRSILMRHNGTLEDDGEHFLIFNFPLNLVIVKRIPDVVTMRRVSMNVYRGATLVGQRNDYLGLTVDARLETIQTIGTIFLKGNAARACDSDVPSFVLVDAYTTLEFGNPGEKTTFESTRQKYLVCCSKQAVCNHKSSVTRYVM